MKLEAVIWDLDGTICDSAALHFGSWQATMAEHGIEYSYELFVAAFGRNNFEILSEQMPDFSPAKIGLVSEEKEAAYRRLVTPGALELLPGVGEWLRQAQALGLSQAIGSSAPMPNIVAMVDILEIGGFFHALLSGYRLPRGKPDPLLFLRCAAAVEAHRDACLVIEDSIHGIEAAHRAGMPCLAVGAIARSEALRPYVEAAWPPCRAVASLAEIEIESISSWYL